MTLVLGCQAELFAEGGAGMEETEVLSPGESDLLSTLSPGKEAASGGSLSRGTACSSDVNSSRN